MISLKVMVVLLCVSVGVIQSDLIERVDRVLQKLILKRTQSHVYGVGLALQIFLDHTHQFKQFVIEHERNYTSDAEIGKRFAIFQGNLREADYYQKNEQGTATYGVNQFADLTAVEFAKGLSPLNWDEIEKFSNPLELKNMYDLRGGKNTAKSIDFRKRGKVLYKVQNQHKCGSCWAHSAAACLESANAIKYNRLVELSKQQLIDCDYLDKGCNGGWPFSAYKYIHSVGGLMEEKDYKQILTEGRCKFNPNKPKVNLKNYYILHTRKEYLTPKNEQAYENHMHKVGPIVAIINADGLRLYKGGVINQGSLLCSKSRDDLNHGVFNVGYDVETVNGKSYPYWILKNSWGDSWGEKGYMRLYRGSNTCGIGWIAAGVVAA